MKTTRMGCIAPTGLMLLIAALGPTIIRAQGSGPGGSGFVKEFGTMWTFDAPPLAYWKSQYGFEPTAAWLENVRLSAVRIPGCSASIVSNRGLVMTNHHCARSCITAVSPPDSNFQAIGFVARDEASERPCRGMTADQLQSITDVTSQVTAAMKASIEARRIAQRDSAASAIEDACSREMQGQGICQVVAFYQGGRYSLYKYHRFTDLRLVMAPEEEVSFYGGDPDNFTFPRYDLDLTLLRIYENGAPLRPANYLRWSEAGAKENELVFVVGNPGSTGRLLTMAQMAYLRDVTYPGSAGDPR